MLVKKTQVLQHIIRHLQTELAVAQRAANTAKETATNKENVAENKYDTLGLEASYLAHGQSVRVHELEKAVHRYENLTLPEFNDDSDIAALALIHATNAQNQALSIFIGPSHGGIKLDIDSHPVYVVSIESPIAQSLLGLSTSDVFKFGPAHVEYEITNVR